MSKMQNHVWLIFKFSVLIRNCPNKLQNPTFGPSVFMFLSIMCSGYVILKYLFDKALIAFKDHLYPVP